MVSRGVLLERTKVKGSSYVKVVAVIRFWGTSSSSSSI
jgi:hypothetical protein